MAYISDITTYANRFLRDLQEKIMNQKDVEFFEAYKRLDVLCRDVLNCKNGVSEYIQQMEVSHQVLGRGTGWSEDYRMLKHIRWVRNQVAHKTSDAPFSTEKDIEFVNAFYDRIMDQDDSFARLRKMELKKKHRRKQIKNKSSEDLAQKEVSNISNRKVSKENSDGIRVKSVVKNKSSEDLAQKEVSNISDRKVSKENSDGIRVKSVVCLIVIFCLVAIMGTLLYGLYSFVSLM